ncbi:MAG TPA: universal stress protein [Solirubrobacteraceae bacterium]|nr:universal stress protein [Solirubrobacteraceae bacterium]
MFRNVLVVIDGSVDSREALDQAIDLARRERSRLTFIAAERRIPTCAYLGVAAAAPLAVPAADNTARDLMREAVGQVPDDIPVTTIITALPIRAALIRLLERGQHDLVMLGERPRGRLRSIVGSLGHYLVRHSPAPVLVVHAERPPSPVTPRPTGAQLRSRRWGASTRSPAT